MQMNQYVEDSSSLPLSAFAASACAAFLSRPLRVPLTSFLEVPSGTTYVFRPEHLFPQRGSFACFFVTYLLHRESGSLFSHI